MKLLKYGVFACSILFFASCQKENLSTSVNNNVESHSYDAILMNGSDSWYGERDLTADRNCRAGSFKNCVALPPVVIRPNQFPTGNGIVDEVVVLRYFSSQKDEDWFNQLPLIAKDKLLSGEYKMVLSASDNNTSTYKFYNQKNDNLYLNFTN